MRIATAMLVLLSPTLFAQAPPPRFLYIYRDSLKEGVDAAYRQIENEAAQICADLKCPNPYLALESLNGPHEAWWINAPYSRLNATCGPPRAPPAMRALLIRWGGQECPVAGRHVP